MNEISSWLMWGNCMENLQLFHDEYFDCLVTDPPYGLQFMGKQWDKAVVGVDVWKECFRVLKAGSFAFIMSAPRLDCLSHMAVNLSDAGFNIGFSPIYWTYASGFPKAMNISKAIDKRLGVEPVKLAPKKYDSPNFADPQFVKQGSMMQTHTKAPRIQTYNTAPKTKEAKDLDGAYAGCQLKPAVEVIIVAMKPLSEGSYVDQALKDGKGVTWVDHCRIPTLDKLGGGNEKAERFTGGWDRPWRHDPIKTQAHIERVKSNVIKSERLGRFPANLLVSDQVLDDGQKQSVGHSPKEAKGIGHTGIYGKYNPIKREKDIYFNDSGGFSRYFDVDAWFEQQLADEGINLGMTFPFLYVPKASPSEKNRQLQGSPKTRETDGNIRSNPETARKYGANPVVKQNFHPTVKPIRLLSYLVVLGSRKGDTVLDPFVGSGSSMMAAEMMKRSVVGMELQPKYYELAKSRLQGRTQEYLDYRVKYLFT